MQPENPEPRQHSYRPGVWGIGVYRVHFDFVDEVILSRPVYIYIYSIYTYTVYIVVCTIC